jgi:hypothetical protein
MADGYERSMDFPASMPDEDIRTYVQEREVDAYGQELVGDVAIREEEDGGKRATWSSQPK